MYEGGEAKLSFVRLHLSDRVCVFQAAIGSAALDMARVDGDEVLVKLGLDVLTVAVLAILTTAPVGALGIGLAGPRLLHRHTEGEDYTHTLTHTYTHAHIQTRTHTHTLTGREDESTYEHTLKATMIGR